MATQVRAAAGGDPAQAPVTAGAPLAQTPVATQPHADAPHSAKYNHSTLPSGGLTVRMPRDGPAPLGRSRRLAVGGRGAEPAWTDQPRVRPSVSPGVPFPSLFSQFQPFTCNSLPDTTAFQSFFFLNASLGGSGAGGGGGAGA